MRAVALARLLRSALCEAPASAQVRWRFSWQLYRRTSFVAHAQWGGSWARRLRSSHDPERGRGSQAGGRAVTQMLHCNLLTSMLLRVCQLLRRAAHLGACAT
jgi:hypothetical protein